MQQYLKEIGFFMNPFQNTNADNEINYIEDYFIAPDYFEDVWGDPSNPCSNIVYAPRGAGKTAQRIMIEKRAVKNPNMICITYTNHDLSQFKSIDEVTYEYHLITLNRLLLLAFFSELDSMDSYVCQSAFPFSVRQYIYKLSKIYLYDTPASFPKQAISSLKTFEDRLLNLWKHFKEPISNVIKEISKNKGLEIDVSKVDVESKLKSSHKDNFFNLIQLFKRIDINTIYILIDKVDEQHLTGNDPKASYKFISSLIKDLELLEMPGVAFKFFLWDALRPYCIKDARPDRIFSYDLNWEFNKLQEMLNKRMQTYSKGRINNALELFYPAKCLGRTILFSEGSPRDCIRICNRILSEQFKYNPRNKHFSSFIVDMAIDKFTDEKINELISNRSNQMHLSKIHSVSFTIEELVGKKVASDVPAIRNIILPWTTMGLLTKIGIVKRKNKKAVNEYAFRDIRMARFACKNMTLNDFINYKVLRCQTSTCKCIYYRDFDKKQYPCPECGINSPIIKLDKE